MHRVLDGVDRSRALFDIDAGVGVGYLSHESPFIPVHAEPAAFARFVP